MRTVLKTALRGKVTTIPSATITDVSNVSSGASTAAEQPRQSFNLRISGSNRVVCIAQYLNPTPKTNTGL